MTDEVMQARPGYRQWGVCVVALSILALQVALTRLLSVVLWYHFAFVAVSLAMLGLAIGGIVLFLFRPLLQATPRLLPWYCRLAGLATIGALVFLVRHPIDTSTTQSIFELDVARFYVVSLLPFLLGGFAISAAISWYASEISRLYLYDLAGAGAGCVLVVVLLNLAGAPATILATASLFFVASWLFHRDRASRRRSLLDPALLVASAALIAGQLLAHPLEPRSMHGRPDALAELGHEKLLERWNSHSRIVVVRTGKSVAQINIDGNATTAIRRLEEPASPESVREHLSFLSHYAGSTPYVALPEHPESMIIGPGGGIDILAGLYHGATVTAVELNGIIFDLLSRGEFQEWSGNVYGAPGVTSVHDEARSWLRRTERRFDLIQAMQIDTWAATATGAFALAENSLYTVEAFEDFFSHLTEEGVVHFTRWHEDPPRQSLRVLVLMDEVLRRSGVAHPAPHIVVLAERTPGVPQAQASILWSRQAFSGEALARLEEYMAHRPEGFGLEKLCWPGEAFDNPLSAYVRASDRIRFREEYPYDVSPTTDDRPFFFQTLRLGDVFRAGSAGSANEQAVNVLVTVLATVAVLVLLSFALPFLLCSRRILAENGPGTLLRLFYFCGLGCGFMLLEIPLLQRFGLYLGHPTYTLSTILASLLVGAGLGSLAAGRLFGTRPTRGIRISLGCVLAGVLATSVVVPGILDDTLTLPLSRRILLSAALLTPLGFALGFPLPLGIQALAVRRKGLVPWAWGVNGATSVLASVGAVALGMSLGFRAAAIVGGACYLAAFLTAPRA